MVASPADAESLEVDERNELHIMRHGVTVAELEQVFENYPRWVPNKKGRTATYLMVGRTLGGRPVIAAVIYDEVRRAVRPISVRECTDPEIDRWL
jgi:uncharacterized DUF497 family protein